MRASTLFSASTAGCCGNWAGLLSSTLQTRNATSTYIGGYFESRRDAYYEALLAMSRDNAWTAWCRVFLEAVRTQAEDNLVKTRAIFDLYESMKLRVPELNSPKCSASYYIKSPLPLMVPELRWMVLSQCSIPCPRNPGRRFPQLVHPPQSPETLVLVYSP